MPTYQSQFTGPQMDTRFAAVPELQEAITALEAAVAAKYAKPAGGIPSTDLDADVNAALAKALTAVQDLSNYYTKAETDAIASAISATVASFNAEVVASLPTASASTMGKFYLVGPDGDGEYDRYVTSYDGSSYAWVPAGTTDIDLSQYATKAELDQLDQKLYGIKITSTDVINGEVRGYTTANYRLSDSGTWASPGKTVFIPVADIVNQLIIVPVSSSSSYKYALVKSTTVTNGAKADYCTGEAVHKIQGVTTTLYKSRLPQDCVYVAVIYKQLNVDPYAVDYAEIEGGVEGGIRENTQRLSHTKDCSRIITTQEILENLESEFVLRSGRITDAGVWNTTGGTGLFLQRSKVDLLRIVPNPALDYTYKYAFLTSADVSDGLSYCTGESKAHAVSRMFDTILGRNDIPTDCTYIYISIVIISAEGNAISSIILNSPSDALSAALDEGQNASIYYGERINLRGYLAKAVGESVMVDWITVDGQSLSGQGGDVFGSVAFRLHDGGYCEVFDIADYHNIVKLASFWLDDYDGHANCCNFGKELSDTGFPYLYVSGGASYNVCYVEKVSEDSSELVQTITISDNITCNVTIGDDGYLWAWTGDGNGPGNNGRMLFYKFALPAVTAGNVVISLDDAIDSWVDDDAEEFLDYYWQGGKIFQGRIYTMFGQSGEGQKRYMVVYDTVTHRRTTIINFTDTIPLEIEDCAVHNARMVIFTNGGRGLRVVDFL